MTFIICDIIVASALARYAVMLFCCLSFSTRYRYQHSNYLPHNCYIIIIVIIIMAINYNLLEITVIIIILIIAVFV